MEAESEFNPYLVYLSKLCSVCLSICPGHGHCKNLERWGLVLISVLRLFLAQIDEQHLWTSLLQVFEGCASATVVGMEHCSLMCPVLVGDLKQ